MRFIKRIADTRISAIDVIMLAVKSVIAYYILQACGTVVGVTLIVSIGWAFDFAIRCTYGV
jgi:hypothetical protein